MKQKLEITIPQTVMDIRLGQFQQYLILVDGLGANPVYNEFTKHRIVSIFCDVPLELIRTGFKAADINRITNDVSKLLIELSIDKENDVDYQFEPTFKIGETKFGFINNFDDMMAGEYADLTTYFEKWETMHKAMAVMYRPVTKDEHNSLLNVEQYEIAEYNGTSEYAELMKAMPAIKALEAGFFLISSFKTLQKCFLAYLSSQVEMTPEMNTMLKANSTNIGDSIKAFTALVDKIY